MSSSYLILLAFKAGWLAEVGRDLSKRHHAAGRCGGAMLDEPNGVSKGMQIHGTPHFLVLPRAQDRVGGALQDSDGVGVRKASWLDDFQLVQTELREAEGVEPVE